MATPRNYVEDRNPFRMAMPPQWWLKGLYNADPDMVVLPSRTRLGVYWLARRKKFTLGLTDAALDKSVKAEDTDTAMFLAHQLEPVVDITNPLGNWALHRILAWLDERDTWKEEGGPLDADGIRKAWANGGSRYTKKVEALEAEIEAKRAADQRDFIYHSTGDGWRSLQARRGERILSSGHATRPTNPADTLADDREKRRQQTLGMPPTPDRPSGLIIPAGV